MSDSLSRSIAHYAVADLGPVPLSSWREARRRVLDSIGVAIGAVDHPAPSAVLRYLTPMSTATGCVLWGTHLRAAPEHAGFYNGALVRCLDYNDAYFGRDSTHPSDMIGALIAIAEDRCRSGPELLDAIAVGYEVAVSCADAFGVRANGWDHVNVTSIGACAGVARLLRLSPRQAEQAIALTIVPHAAMLQTRSGDLSMWKGIAAPHGGRLALQACLLAEAGVEGPFEPFEGKHGFLALLLDGVVPDEGALESIRTGGAPTRIRDTHIKAWPLGYVAQSAVAATLEAREALPEGEVVTQVRVSTYGVAVELMGSSEKYRPGNRETADHSLPYVVLAALDHGGITESTFEAARVTDPAVHERLVDLIEVVEDLALSRSYPGAHPARVELVTASGRSAVAQVDHPPGHAKNPLSEADLERKFYESAGEALGDRAQAVLEAVAELDAASDVSQLTSLLSLDRSTGDVDA